jgi:hypothetical protein
VQDLLHDGEIVAASIAAPEGFHARVAVAPPAKKAAQLGDRAHGGAQIHRRRLQIGGAACGWHTTRPARRDARRWYTGLPAVGGPGRSATVGARRQSGDRALALAVRARRSVTTAVRVGASS